MDDAPPLSRSLRVLMVSGSLRSGSTNTAVLRTAAATSPAWIEAAFFERVDRLPHFNPDDDVEGAPPQAVAALRAQLAVADAVLVCTPEYAGALPGAFKNLLEWTVGGAGLYGKPVAWINASGVAAPTGGEDAHRSLRKVLGFVGADLVEEACVRVPIRRDEIGEDGLVHDAAAVEAISRALATLAHHTLTTKDA